MELRGIHTPLLQPGNDLAKILVSCEPIADGDIVVISSKAIATVENAFIDLSKMNVSHDAEGWSEKTGRTPAFCEAVLAEMQRLNGSAVGHCPGAIVTEVSPHGMEGSIITANAGLDQSNAPEGTAIGWPVDPVGSARALREALETPHAASQPKRIGVIITDSCLRPRRRGVLAFALTVSGLEPIRSEAGRNDLYNHPLRITSEAVADQLATAANFLMGNAEQAMPACIIRDHGLQMTEDEGWVPGINRNDDLFRGIV